MSGGIGRPRFGAGPEQLRAEAVWLSGNAGAAWGVPRTQSAPELEVCVYASPED